MNLLKNCIILLILCSSLAAADSNYKRVIVFGDSYSDNGNVFKLTHEKYPNPARYYQGRFSDGPVWSEYFAQQLNINPNDPAQFINLAYGQAKILRPTDITVFETKNYNYPIPNLAEQIDYYQQHYGRFKKNDIVTVFISANDFFDTPITPAAITFFQNLATEEVKQIQRLIQLNAQHIIVFNGRDVTYSPLAHLVAEQNSPVNDENTISAYLLNFQKLIQEYNQNLADGVKNYNQVFVYDIYNFDHKTISKIENGGLPYKNGEVHYTLKNAHSLCYQNIKGEYQGIAGLVCNNPQEYFFYDRIHTTKYVNKILAQDVYQKVISSSMRR